MANTKTAQKKREAFLSMLAEQGNILRACEASGFERGWAYQLKAKDADFSAAWDKALEEAADRMEAEAWRRAIKGTERPVYQKGCMVGMVQEYSDVLLIFMLKGTRPDKFRDNIRQEITGRNGGPLQHEHSTDLSKLTLEEKKALRDLLHRATPTND